MGTDVTMFTNMVMLLPWLMYGIDVKNRILSNKVMEDLSGINPELYLVQMVVFVLLRRHMNCACLNACGSVF